MSSTKVSKASKQVKINDAIKAISSGNTSTLLKDKKESKKDDKKKVVIEVEDEVNVNDEKEFNSSFEVSKKKGDLTYKKLELKEQILLRPDTYIGSCKLLPETVYIKEGSLIKEREIKYPEGLIRLFVEILSNAIDNVWRSLQEDITPKFIKVNVDKETGKISVWNDGKNIPLSIHPEEKVHIPEMIFGQFLTSSNYNDNEERKTSGRNGLGGKACNLFSSLFRLEIYNKDSSQIYQQEWTNNMGNKTKPTFKTKGFPKTIEDGKNGYTLVEFIPDFKRFNVDTFTPDILSLYEKLVYDTAMTVCLKGVKVIFNGEIVKVNTIKDYVNLYFNEPPKDMLLLSSKDCRVVLCPSSEFTHVSFVNGIYTREGGIHVKKWSDVVFKPIVEKINDTLKGKGHIDISHVKKHFFMFVYADLVNPSFKSQNKTYLDGPQVEAEIKDNDIKKLMKWGFVDKIKDSLKTKELNTLKTETERKRGTVNVEGLDDANFAGKKGKNVDCVLLCTEGDSANTYAIAGMKYGLKINGKEIKGRDYIGSLPVRGKFLNVRNASIQTLLKNNEVKSLIQAIGLQHDVDYSIDDNFKKLRYGRLMALTDADSVTGDTPLLLRKNEIIYIKTIDDISESEWVSYGGEKEYNKTSYEVWTDKGWTSIKHIMKHKTTKKMFRVVTHTGIVDVTEDHSLLREDGEEIEPKNIKVDEFLLHSYPMFTDNKIDIPNKTIEEYTCEELRDILRHYKIRGNYRFTKLQAYNKVQEIKNMTYEKLNSINNISSEEAWVMGFFWADGTCGVYKYQLERKPKNRPNVYTFNRTNYSWGICNTNKDYLEKSLFIMEKYYPEYEWKIIEDRTNFKTRNIKIAYKLICNGGVKTLPLIEKYRELFYNNEKKKRIPSDILNASKEVREAFLEGYLYGDGNKESDGVTLKTREIKFDIDGKIGASGLFFLCRSLGYLVSVNTRNDKPKVISMNITKGTQQDHPCRIKKIIELGETETEVYDLETENHHFQAGVGQMIVHNTDGYHISGLLFNFIHTLFPSLAKRKGFFSFMRIPIVKITGKKPIAFFSQHAAEEYITKNNVKKDDIKYFKGLGTAQDEDIEEDFGRRLVEVDVDEKGDEMMVNVFGKENADFRKEWIMNYTHKHQPEGKDYCIENLNITDFLNNELILFSIDDCKRSIPCMLDGLKESQRKILFSAFKRRLNYDDKSIKVAQFSGYVAEHSNYHHGEQNLVDTTIKMAQTFVSSNNIPLFFNEGQFGSRVKNGEDAASGRYLFTKLNMPTRKIFRSEDDEFLKDRVEEGDLVEKEFYVPIVPMILVNGCSAGIGSGFSSSIPSHKLEDIINQIYNYLEGKEFEDIVPHFRGFKGSINVDGKKVITEGIFEEEKVEKSKGKCYRVKEIPIGKSNMSIYKYKNFLMELQEEKKIISFTNNSTESIVDFTVVVGEDVEVDSKFLNLIDNVYLSNMVMFDPNNKIKKYDTVKDILKEFCDVRYGLYEVRKEGILKNMEEELLYLKNKIKFIGEIINSTISLKERDDDSLIEELKTKKYSLKEGTYEYLLTIQVRSMTSKRLEELKNKKINLEKEIEEYRNKTIKSIWKEELSELLKEYNKWLSFENERKVSKKDKKIKIKSKVNNK